MLSLRKRQQEYHQMLGIVAALLLFTLALTACGADAADADAGEAVQIRTPHPTFTPTPVQAAPPTTADAVPAPATPAAVTASAVADGAATDTTPSGEKAKLIINIDLVNLRDAPSIDSTVITILERGEEFDILGRDASGEWWFVCCYEDKGGWVTGEFADFVGPADQAPIVGADATVPTPTAQTQTAGTAASAPQAGQGGPVAAQASAATFDLNAQEQFPETGVVRIYAYIFDERSALAGYSIQVTKDGVLLPVNELSFGPNGAFTWPVADPRQRAQNLKVEFPGVDAAGVWQIQLVQGDNAIGPVATFTLGDQETNRELYVRYKRR